MRDNTELQKSRWLGAVIALLLLVASPFTVMADNSQADTNLFRISPSEIQIGASYHGEQLNIDITHLPDDQFILKLEGKRESIKLSKKGRVSFLWMTVGEIVFKNTPQVYLINASQKLDDLGSESGRLQFGLGYAALEKQLQIEASPQERQESFREFVKMKEKGKLYGIHGGPFPAITMKDGRRHISFKLDIPSTMPAGKYAIDLYLVRDGKILMPISKQLTMRKTGLVSFIADLAYNYAKLYGVIAVALAVLIGVLIGLLFAFLKKVAITASANLSLPTSTILEHNVKKVMRVANIRS